VVLWNPGEDTSAPAEGRGPGLHPHLPAAQLVRSVVQHDDQPGEPRGARSRRIDCWSSRFAQYQADRSVVSLVRGVERGQHMLDEGRRRVRWTRCSPSSNTPGLREQISQQERAQAPRVATATSTGGQRRAGRAAARRHHHDHPRPDAADWPSCWKRPRDSTDPRPLVLTENRWAGRISSADYSGESAPVGSMTLPKRVEHRQPRVRRDLASALRSAAAGLSTTAERRGKHSESRDCRPRAGGAARKDASPSGSPRNRPGNPGPGRRAVPADGT